MDKDIIQNQEIINEPVETVSNEDIQKTEEWIPPQTKEEFEKALKSTSSRAQTNILKDLGVASIKEFKIQQAEINEKLEAIGTLEQERNEINDKYMSLSEEYNSLKRETTLNSFNVADEYKEDIAKLAALEVNDDKPFEDAVKELVEGRYKHVVASPQLRMGVERRQAEEKNTISAEMRQRYPWLNKK